jgi:hypothetical protein
MSLLRKTKIERGDLGRTLETRAKRATSCTNFSIAARFNDIVLGKRQQPALALSTKRRPPSGVGLQAQEIDRFFAK